MENKRPVIWRQPVAYNVNVANQTRRYYRTIESFPLFSSGKDGILSQPYQQNIPDYDV